MWCFTRYGLFSVVFKEGTIVLRARRRSDLLRLQRRVRCSWRIEVTPNSDYTCRVRINRHEWVNIASILAEEVTWSNFKNECKRYGGDADYLNLLHRVWEAGLSYQYAPHRVSAK